MTNPYALPDKLEPDLCMVHDYWQGLIRGDNHMPFWDDFKPSALPDLAPRLALIDVFGDPFRLHFGHIVGAEIEKRYGEPVSGRFLDDMVARAPFDLLASQGSAAVELSKPNLYRRKSDDDSSYLRLLLPMWGNGRIERLLCAFSWR